MSASRPTAVTVIAVLLIIGGALGVLGGLAGLFLGAAVGVAGGSGEAAAAGGLVALLSIVAIVLSLVNFVIAYGLWTLKPWAWIATLVLEGISILLSLGNVVSGNGAGGAVFGIAIAGVIIYYLMQPNVKQAFGRA
jgi:hypothetical protein